MTSTNETSLVAQGANHGGQPQIHQHGQEILAVPLVDTPLIQVLSADAGRSRAPVIRR